jgi:hypothetical protein
MKPFAPPPAVDLLGQLVAAARQELMRQETPKKRLELFWHVAVRHATSPPRMHGRPNSNGWPANSASPHIPKSSGTGLSASCDGHGLNGTHSDENKR